MRDEGSSSARGSLLVVPFYLVASLILTWPLARHFGSELPAVTVPYDALLHVFLLGWGWRGLTTHPLAVFDAPIFHPEPRTLTYMDHMLGEAVVAGPAIGVFGIGAAYNFLIVLSFVASGYFTYRLARLFGVSRAGSAVAGFLFAFCPYRFSHLGCLNQIQTQFIPLGLFFAVRFLRGGRMRDGVGSALTLAVQGYFGWYSTFHLLTALVVLTLWEGMREPGGWGRLPWRKGAPLALGAAVLIIPSALPYIQQRIAMPEFRRPFAEVVRCSADLTDYVRVNADNILAQGIPPFGHWAGFFPGLVATSLAVLAIVALYRKPGRGMGFFTALGATGLVLSLGPLLHVAGHRLWIPLPYAFLYYVAPGFASMRTPGRFAVLVALATAVLAGAGLDVLRRRYSRHGGVILGGTLLAAGVLAWSPTLPFVRHADRASMPPVYGWLAAQPDSDPVLELPVPATGTGESSVDLRRQMYVLYHGKPRLDGASGFTSERYEAFRRDMQAFPAPETIRRARDMGARRLIVHYGDYAPERREEILSRVAETKLLREAAAFGTDVVYEIGGDAG